nr:hypothetical protein [Gemmatimonadaceae bacterium]
LVHGAAIVCVAATTVACSSSSGPCDDDGTNPLRPVLRVQAVDPAGRTLETMVSRILDGGARTDTVRALDLVRVSPGLNSLRAMTIAVIATGYRESIVELGEICFPAVDDPVIVPLRPQ